MSEKSLNFKIDWDAIPEKYNWVFQTLQGIWCSSVDIPQKTKGYVWSFNYSKIGHTKPRPDCTVALYYRGTQPPVIDEFVREDRYYVMKISNAVMALSHNDLETLKSLFRKVAQYRSEKLGLDDLECVVIESDWGCYEKAWELVEEEFWKKNPV